MNYGLTCFIFSNHKSQYMPYYCNNCKRTISKNVFSYSMNHHGKALCMDCQKNFSPQKGKRREKEPEIDVVSGVNKIVRGVSHIIKERAVKNETDFNKWTADWRKVKNLDFSMDNRHFFLIGMDLDDFTKQLIRMAKQSILIANPFIESCYLTDALITSAQSSTKIKIVTRRPKMKERKKAECHSKLKRTNIQLRYDNQIHSKIMVVDNSIAVVSSMNFYSGSSGGASKEAGIVSMDKQVVESSAKYIQQLFAAL